VHSKRHSEFKRPSPSFVLWNAENFGSPGSPHCFHGSPVPVVSCPCQETVQRLSIRKTATPGYKRWCNYNVHHCKFTGLCRSFTERCGCRHAQRQYLLTELHVLKQTCIFELQNMENHRLSLSPPPTFTLYKFPHQTAFSFSPSHDSQAVHTLPDSWTSAAD